MKGIVANPNIGPHVKQSVLAYYQHDLLLRFYTTFYEHSHYPLSRLLSFIFPKIKKELKRRTFEELPYRLIQGKPFNELIRITSARKFSIILTDWIWERSELLFDRWVASKLKEDFGFVHVVEHAALATIKKAKFMGIPVFYEQSSVHHHVFIKMIHTQIAKYPAFDNDITKIWYDESSVRRNKRRDDELNLADFIICNSTFTKNSLVEIGINPAKILTIPLGFPDVRKYNLPNHRKAGKIIFMGAGNLTLGKGTHILLNAWKEINLYTNDAELWLVGKNNLPDEFTSDLPTNVKLINNIPRAQLMDLYYEADVFIHPTLADGFGMVISEAMSCGLPVITTYNSAGPDIIDDKINGILIPSDDKSAIINSIIWCIDNRMKLAEMGISALNKAATYPWAAYRDKLVKTIKTALKDE